MTIQDQFAQYPIQGADIPCFNYGTTDIAANTVVSLDTTNYLGDGTVTHTIPGVVVAPTGANPPSAVGITIETIKAKQSGRVRIAGLATATAYLPSGSIAPGDYVDATPTSGHIGTVTTHTAAKITFGIAWSGTSTDGDPVLVQILPGKNA